MQSHGKCKIKAVEIYVKVKVKVHPRTGHGGVEVYLYSFFNLGARLGWVVSAMPRPLYPQERPGTHCIGGRAGPMAGLDRCVKISPPPGFDPWTIQPIASRFTD